MFDFNIKRIHGKSDINLFLYKFTMFSKVIEDFIGKRLLHELVSDTPDGEKMTVIHQGKFYKIVKKGDEIIELPVND